jgi:hypothetical protein
LPAYPPQAADIGYEIRSHTWLEFQSNRKEEPIKLEEYGITLNYSDLRVQCTKEMAE